MAVQTRVFSCQGCAQLVTAAAAAAASPATSTHCRDYLVIHSLSAPGDQSAHHAGAIRLAAEAIGDWEKIEFIGNEDLRELTEFQPWTTWNSILARVRERVGASQADELYLSCVQTTGSRLLRSCYLSARTICFGDGIGVNFSHSYFAAQPLRSHWLSQVVRKSGQLAVRGSRAFKRLVTNHHFRDPKPPKQWHELEMDEYRLLLPGLFDEPAPPHRQTNPRFFRDAFSRIGKVLERDLDGLEELANALAGDRRVVFLLTSNFSEWGRMTVENEVAGYLDLVAGLERRAGTIIVVKPHPRDATTKIDLLRKALSHQCERLIVLDSPSLHYVPFEAVFAHCLEYQPDLPQRTVAVCTSTACLSLEYLYGVQCIIGFGEEIVRRFFAPEWLAHRLQHEADLGRALQAIRSGEFAYSAARST